MTSAPLSCGNDSVPHPIAVPSYWQSPLLAVSKPFLAPELLAKASVLRPDEGVGGLNKRIVLSQIYNVFLFKCFHRKLLSFSCFFQKHLLFLHTNSENHDKEETYIHQL